MAGLARLEAGALRLTGVVASLDGQTVLRGALTGPAGQAEALGARLAEELIARGARPLIAARGCERRDVERRRAAAGRSR